MSSRAGLFVIACALVLGTGCPSGSGQQRYASLPSLTTDDPEAEADLRAANAAAEAGDSDDAQERYRRFLSEHPEDALVPLAELGLGRVLLAGGHVEEALARFESVAASDRPEVAEAGQFYQGVGLQLAGRHAEAIDKLTPLVGRTTDPRETELLLRTLSAAAQAEGRTTLALEALDRLVSSDALEEAERTAVREEIRSVVTAAPEEEITEAYAELSRDGEAWPEVAVRTIRVAFDNGNMPFVLEVVADLRERQIAMSEELAELAVRAERTERADPRVIGAILPLTGRGREVGQRAVRGLMLASGSPAAGPPDADAPQLVMRDDGGDPLRAAAAVEDLVSEHRAIAIVGPLEGAAARAAAQRAQELGVPLITLVPDPRVTEQGPMVFRLYAGALEEVTSLVRVAHARGARRFAVLQPDHAYGRAMARAYREAVTAVGGELAAEESYEAGATSFGEVVSRLEGVSFDALFVPDAGRALTLIAPALAAANLWSTAAGASPPRGGRAIVLLAPSVALDVRLTGNTSRYLQGALFAAPFHAETADDAGRAFVDAFQLRFQARPDAFAAYAYDAFRLVRGAVEDGQTTRAGVAEWLTTHGRRATVGASGGIGASRQPAEPSRLLEVRGDHFARPEVPAS